MLDDDEKLQCEGCGVTLQMDDRDKVGYVPIEALERIPVICQRCFRIKHYNEMSSATVNQDDFLRMLGTISTTRSLVVHIVDLFDFEGSMISGLQRFIGTNPVLLVVNKIDLLPKLTNKNRILNWVQKQAKDFGLKVVDVVLVSAKKNEGFDRLLEKLDTHRGGRDVYVVGATNVGKSTLINNLIQSYSDLDMELTTSPYPGTTLDWIRIPLDDGRSIIDTPGIVYKHRMSEVIKKHDLKALLPDKTLNPIVFQLNPEQTLFFGSLARFDFVQGERQSFSCYVSGGIKIHRTKLERADELYAEHKGTMLTPPVLADLDALPAFTKHAIRVPQGATVDILISGLGWIRVNGLMGATLHVHAPKGVKVMMRPALI